MLEEVVGTDWTTAGEPDWTVDEAVQVGGGAGGLCSRSPGRGVDSSL